MMNKILIIDDEESLLTTLEMLFDSEGYSVQTAGGGREGLEKLTRDNMPDLLISDIKMPDLDGIEVLREVRKIDPYLPVVLITAHADKKEAIAACNEGADCFLEKPFENKELLKICCELMEEGRVRRRYSERRREIISAQPPELPVGEAPEFKRALEIAKARHLNLLKLYTVL